MAAEKTVIKRYPLSALEVDVQLEQSDVKLFGTLKLQVVDHNGVVLAEKLIGSEEWVLDVEQLRLALPKQVVRITRGGIAHRWLIGQDDRALIVFDAIDGSMPAPAHNRYMRMHTRALIIGDTVFMEDLDLRCENVEQWVQTAIALGVPPQLLPLASIQEELERAKRDEVLTRWLRDG